MPATQTKATTTDLTYAQYAEWLAAQLRAVGRTGVDSLCTLSSGEQFTVHHDVCQ